MRLYLWKCESPVREAPGPSDCASRMSACSAGSTRSTATATSSGAGSGRAARSSPPASSGGAITTATSVAAGVSPGILIPITGIPSAATITLPAKASDRRCPSGAVHADRPGRPPRVPGAQSVARGPREPVTRTSGDIAAPLLASRSCSSSSLSTTTSGVPHTSWATSTPESPSSSIPRMRSSRTWTSASDAGRLVCALETHTHADHVSGHGRLALEHGVPVACTRRPLRRFRTTRCRTAPRSSSATS